jgi:Cu/Ag efflux protein CusF
MNILKNFALGALLATTTLVSTSLLAQPAMDMSGMKEKGMSMEMSNGEVKKIDIEAQKITLKHGDIKSMDMPGMTMVFRTQDPSLLDNLKLGDKIKFNAEKREGFIVVTAIEAIK